MYVSMTSMCPALVVAWSYWSQTPALMWSVLAGEVPGSTDGSEGEVAVVRTDVGSAVPVR